jgi:Rrf2 family transcriptional regulator, nitric oxide-sensitive transcriptional repressor
MQLTQYSDIGLRLLMYLSKERSTFPAITLAEVSDRFNIPRNHLAKVAAKLVKHGWIESIRGRSGGLRLAVEPSEIILGKVLRVLEGHVEVIDCNKLQCRLKNVCALKQILESAYAGFFIVLDQYTLADVTDGLAANEIGNMHRGFIEIFLNNSAVH